MIEANELRPGNKIKANVAYGGAAKTFSRLNEDLTVAFFSDGSIHGIGEYLEDCDMEPLTEQWLVKAGLAKTASNRRELDLDNGFTLATSLSNSKGYVLLYYRQEWTGQIIDSVHRLQNLYFTLTQKELIFK